MQPRPSRTAEEKQHGSMEAGAAAPLAVLLGVSVLSPLLHGLEISSPFRVSSHSRYSRVTLLLGERLT